MFETVAQDIDDDFDWSSEEGQVTELLLEMACGLREDQLTKEQRELLIKHDLL